jgi:hypothetical protein
VNVVHGFWFIDCIDFVIVPALPHCSEHCTAGWREFGTAAQLDWLQFEAMGVSYAHIE